LPNFVTCITEQHDPIHVLVALAVATVGAALTLSLHIRAAMTRGTRRGVLVVVAGMIGGSTVWSTHFIWMLGMKVDFSHSYGFIPTLLSLIVVMWCCILGFAISVRENPGLSSLSGPVIGAGMGAMHFIGLYGLVVDGLKSYDYDLVALSVCAGVALSWLSLHSLRSLRPRYGRPLSVTLFVGAIFVLHYIGMTSLTISPFELHLTSNMPGDNSLLVAVVFVTGMMMLLGVSAYWLDSQATTQRLAEMEHRAYHDYLTGLPNRALFNDRLRAALGRPFDNKRLVVVMLGLDRFKEINDVHGHHAGDEVLKAVAARLDEAMRAGEFLCRIGGDEFAVFRVHSDRGEIDCLAARLRTAATEPVFLNGKSLALGCSMGAVISPDDGFSADELFIKADLAMRRAKRVADNRLSVFDQQVDGENRDKSALSIDLRQALELGQFELRYQRQNRIDDGKVVGYEVLLRWKHPQRGYVPPDVFIPIAERDGLIDRIGEWVLRNACLEAAEWIVPARIAVNVAARQLAGGALPGIVKAALAQSGLSPHRLEIEITETGIIADVERAHVVVNELKAIGVTIAMDDFGTGNSSLSMLQAFPFDKIKIDKSFVRGISSNRQSRAILETSIALGRALDIAVLAEGVETDEDLEFLRDRGCAQVQGFLFGMPLPSHLVGAPEAAVGPSSTTPRCLSPSGQA
jgi:diguanylate cyclase (GGDEF)-like protein